MFAGMQLRGWEVSHLNKGKVQLPFVGSKGEVLFVIFFKQSLHRGVLAAVIEAGVLIYTYICTL